MTDVDTPRFEYTEVPTAKTILHHGLGHGVIPETQSELKAGLPRLADLENDCADRYYISGANRHLVTIRQGKIFAEPTGHEQLGVLRKNALPRGVVREGVRVYSFIWATVDSPIHLFITG